MGGFGSGGWNATGRPTTGELPRLDVNRLNKLGMLRAGYSGVLNWTDRIREMRMSIKTGPDCISLHNARHGCGQIDEIWITWESCRFGGRRPFFFCPDCGRRVLQLYRLGHFACRTCHDLTYQSQRERESDRAQRRANRIRVSLGGEPGWRNLPPRPKGMHLRRYQSQVFEILEADSVTRRYMARILKIEDV